MSDGLALGFLMVPIVSKCLQISEKNQAACLTEEDETTSKSSMEVEVQGDTDESRLQRRSRANRGSGGARTGLQKSRDGVSSPSGRDVLSAMTKSLRVRCNEPNENPQALGPERQMTKRHCR